MHHAPGLVLGCLLALAGPSFAVAAPQAVPTATPASGTAPLAVDFAATVPGAVFYEWDFDFVAAVGFRPDFCSSTDGNVTFTYTVPKTYTARLRTHDAGGATTDQDLTVTVASPPGAPVVVLSVAPDPPVQHEAAVFTASVTTSGGATVSGYMWDLDDDGQFDVISASDNTLTHTFDASGAHDIHVTVFDSQGNTGLATFTANVQVCNICPAFSPGDPFDLTVSSGGTSIFNPTAADTLDVRVGETVQFDFVQTMAGGGLIPIVWDLDGNTQRDAITLTSGDPAASTLIHQYDAPGTYLVTATISQLEIHQITLNVTIEPGVFKTWIAHPRNGLRVWGDRVTLFAKTVPAGQTASVEFKYRPAGGSPFPPPTDSQWISIGTAVPPPLSFLSVHWDVTPLAPGSYDLIAVGSSTGGQTASSAVLREITVVVDPVGFDEEENTSGGTLEEIRRSGVDPNRTEESGISGDTVLQIPSGATSSFDLMRILRRRDNPHPLEARLQGLHFIPGKFRTLTFEGGSFFTKLARVSMYVDDDDGDGIVDGSTLQKSTLRIMRFNDAERRWEPLFSQVVDPEDDLIQAALLTTGDIGLAATPLPRQPSTASSDCGLLGLEALLLLLLPIRRLARRRR